MAHLKFININKIYDNNVQAVFDFNLEVFDKEFIVFVGPSGCGKSTTLRMLAGLESISSGELYSDGVLINDIAPVDRNMAMVFQNYALYPHMSVYENLAFGLKMRKFPVEVLDEKGERILVIDKNQIYDLNYDIKKYKAEIKKALADIEVVKAGNLEEFTPKKELDALIAEKQKRILEAKDKIIDLKKDPTAIEEVNLLKENVNSLKLEIKQAQKTIKRIISGKLRKYLSVEEYEALIAKREKEIAQNEEKIKELQAAPSTYKFKLIKMPKEQIDEKVKYAAEILGLTPYLKRKPANLSGGQRQRVALGRAIVRNPKVFLMDEPLSNLDAKLRVSMRSEITKIHKRVGATTVYVTHDQTEAMTMADRMVVMKDGYIQQIGTPKEIYFNPCNMFVAGFIGAPSMNFLRCKFDGENLMVYIITENSNSNDLENATDSNVLIKIPAKLQQKLENYVGKDVILGIRPEDVYIVDEKEATLQISSELSELLGTETIIYGEVNNQAVNLKTSCEINTKDNNLFNVKFNLDRVHLFDPDTTKAI